MNARDRYEAWLNSSVIDPETKEELRRIAGDEKEIEERFHENLKFGTGGLRGAMGAGTNRMNRYMVRIATQGLANYLLKEGYIQDGRACARVAISYDNRCHSQEFALETAGVLVANGVEVHMYPVLHPTPMLSFAVRYLSCDAGVNITASHNPKEDNGYKVYGPDGSQVVAPMDKAIMREVNAIGSLEDCRFLPDSELLVNPLFHIISAEVDTAFIEEVKALCHSGQSIDASGQEAGDFRAGNNATGTKAGNYRAGDNATGSEPGDFRAGDDKITVPCAESISVVYSPLHGTGLVPVTRVLQELGFRHVHVVDGQAIQDGGFPTVRKPNPENPEAFALATEHAKKLGADLIILTDPDADRTGIRVLDKESGGYIHFTGNMMGALLTEYVLSRRAQSGTMPENPAVVSTVVITDLIREICASYGVHCEAAGLIGFKNLAKVIRAYEEEGSYHYVFGLEDSDGCLPGTYARDKDSVGTAALLACAAAYYHEKGMTLWDQMRKIYEKYGYYAEDLKSKKLAGMEGQQKIADMIAALREHPLTEIAGRKAVLVTDYKLNRTRDLLTGEERDAGVDASNMIYYRLEGGWWFLVRPSGTEPTIKFYVGAKGDNIGEANANSGKLMDALMEVFA